MSDNKVCPGRKPRTYDEWGMIESNHPEIADVRNTHFCFCENDAYAEPCGDPIEHKKIDYQIIKLSSEELFKMNPCDPFKPINRNFCYRPMSRICNCVIL